MERKLKVKIAFLYYSIGLTQDEIARKLNLTRQKVNTVIGNLRNDGIVTVSIQGLEEAHVDWEKEIEETFGINHVIIAEDYADPSLSLLKTASVAAQYLDTVISAGDTVGVSWGRTLAATIREMRPSRKPDCRVVQLLGTQSMDEFPMKSDDIVRALANKLDCPTYMLYAPAIVSRAETRTMLLQENIIRHAFDRMRTCNVGIFGIGELTEDAPMCKMGFISKDELRQLRNDGFCADIGMNPVRADGSSGGSILDDRLLTAGIDCIRNMEKTIAIASGIEKADAVAAVLRSGCINTLIIDSSLAKKMINNMNIQEAHK